MHPYRVDSKTDSNTNDLERIFENNGEQVKKRLVQHEKRNGGLQSGWEVEGETAKKPWDRVRLSPISTTQVAWELASRAVLFCYVCSNKL